MHRNLLRNVYKSKWEEQHFNKSTKWTSSICFTVYILSIYVYLCVCVCARTLNTYLPKIQTQILWKWNEQISFSLAQLSLAIRKLFSMRRPANESSRVELSWVECVSGCLSRSYPFPLCLCVCVMSLRVWSDVRVCLSSMRSPARLASVCISIETQTINNNKDRQREREANRWKERTRERGRGKEQTIAELTICGDKYFN